MSLFSVEVDDVALAVALRDRVDKPADLVQAVLAEYFAPFEKVGRAEVAGKLQLAFEAADDNTKQTVLGVLGVSL